LIAALSDAARWCDEPANAADLAELLGAASHLNLPARAILPGLTGEFDCGHGRIERIPDFLVCHRHGANVPSVEKAIALQHELSSAGLLPEDVDSELPRRLFREDLYHNALKLEPQHETTATSDLRGSAL